MGIHRLFNDPFQKGSHFLGIPYIVSSKKKKKLGKKSLNSILHPQNSLDYLAEKSNFHTHKKEEILNPWRKRKLKEKQYLNRAQDPAKKP
jgi:hypothetical protein